MMAFLVNTYYVFRYMLLEFYTGRSGRVGLQGNANSSCGLQLTIDVGQLTD